MEQAAFVLVAAEDSACLILVPELLVVEVHHSECVMNTCFIFENLFVFERPIYRE